MRAFAVGFSEEITKLGARAGLKLIRSLVGKGDIAGASRLSKTPGVIKPSAMGSEIKDLGQGSEGLATLTAHPHEGLSVRKLYDPKGLTTPETWERKRIAGEKIESPHVARFRGEEKTKGGGTAHFYEYIHPGKEPPKGVREPLVRQTKAKTITALRRAGFSGGQDIRHGNMVWDPATKQYKTIDYIPAKTGEFDEPGPGLRKTLSIPSNQIFPHEPGKKLFNQSFMPETRSTPGELKSQLIAGKPAKQRSDEPVSQPGLTDALKKLFGTGGPFHGKTDSELLAMGKPIATARTLRAD